MLRVRNREAILLQCSCQLFGVLFILSKGAANSKVFCLPMSRVVRFT